jgi:hypothetical protein
MPEAVSKKEIQKIEQSVSPLVQKAGRITIKSQTDVDKASINLRELQQVERSIEAKRLEFTAPLNQSLKAINDTFKLLKAPIQQARGIISNRILEWRRIEQDRIAKEEERRRKIQEAHAKQGHDVNAPVILERPENKIGNTQVSKVWKWEVEDFAKLPDEFKVINSVALNTALREARKENKVPEIAGVKFYEDESLSIVGR